MDGMYDICIIHQLYTLIYRYKAAAGYTTYGLEIGKAYWKLHWSYEEPFVTQHLC